MVYWNKTIRRKPQMSRRPLATILTAIVLLASHPLHPAPAPIPQQFRSISMLPPKTKAFVQAVRENRSQDVLQWLSDGNFVDQKIISGMTPLMLAIAFQSSDVVSVLLEAGASLESRNKEQRTPLMLAAEYNNVEALSMLIAAGATLESTDDAGLTALAIATDSNSTEAAKELLRAGANAFHADKRKRSVIVLAVSNGNKEIVRMLSEAGVPVDRAAYGHDPFTLATLGKDTEMMALMLELGADVNCRNQHTQRTPLHMATDYEVLPSVKFLLEHGANPNLQDNRGRTALIFLAENDSGNTRILQLLVDADADMDVKNNKGWTALMLAAEKNNTTLVQQLIQGGADLEVENQGQYTALAIALLNNAAEAAAILIGSGADIARTTSQGGTMLMAAAYGNSPRCIRLLIEAGAKIHATDKHGMTAMDYARLTGAEEALDVLESLDREN